MKALRLLTSALQPLLVEAEMPRPEPLAGEVVVRVRAVAVTPTEVRWHTTWHTRDGGPRSGAVLGHEPSGGKASATAFTEYQATCWNPVVASPLAISAGTRARNSNGTSTGIRA